MASCCSRLASRRTAAPSAPMRSRAVASRPDSEPPRSATVVPALSIWRRNARLARNRSNRRPASSIGASRAASAWSASQRANCRPGSAPSRAWVTRHPFRPPRSGRGASACELRTESADAERRARRPGRRQDLRAGRAAAGTLCRGPDAAAGWIAARQPRAAARPGSR